VPGNQFSQINSQFPLGDTSYVYTNVINSIDNFFYQPVSPFNGDIFGVQYLLYMRKDQEGTRAVQQFAGPSGSPEASGPVWYLGDSYLYYIWDLDVDPATMTQWTQSGFNNTKFGFLLSV